MVSHISGPEAVLASLTDVEVEETMRLLAALLDALPTDGTAHGDIELRQNLTLLLSGFTIGCRIAGSNIGNGGLNVQSNAT